jgi:hypothetical protein
MTDSTPKKKRRILLKATIAIVLFIAILIALLPTILSMGLVRGIARDAIAGSVNGEVDLAAVKLGWLSDQRVEGLSFRDKDGSNAVDVTLTLRGGLLGLVFSGGTGGADGLDLVVSGSIVGTRSADGTLGLESLFKSGDGSAGSAAAVAELDLVLALVLALVPVDPRPRRPSRSTRSASRSRISKVRSGMRSTGSRGLRPSTGPGRMAPAR